MASSVPLDSENLLNAAIIIPARMASSRFPGKPLAPILGMPMIEHVFHRSSLGRGTDLVFVATCDDEIRQVVEGFGGNVVMTSGDHRRASDRVAEAAAMVDADLIVMVQGDEPMVTPAMIDSAVAPFVSDPGLQCVNLASRIRSEAELLDPNTIKVVFARDGSALYFSRQPIPDNGGSELLDVEAHKQVCVIPFRRAALDLFQRLPATPLEESESIDMLRFLEHGHPVQIVPIDEYTHPVDTPDDLREVETLLREDPLVRDYLPRGPS